MNLNWAYQLKLWIEFGLNVSGINGRRGRSKDISKEALCFHVLAILQNFPDAWETLLTRAVQARNICIFKFFSKKTNYFFDLLFFFEHTYFGILQTSSVAVFFRNTDGNHKLIIYHVYIDCYSRFIIYLYFSLNNFEATALHLFQLFFYYNFPSRVKSDMGIKDIDVARFMLDNQGLNRRL